MSQLCRTGDGRDSVSHKRLKSFWPDIINGGGRTLAEIGAGAGGSLVVYRDLGWEAVGIEPGEQQGRFARDVLNVNMKTEYYSRTSFSPESLDTMPVNFVFRIIEMLARMCIKNGRLKSVLRGFATRLGFFKSNAKGSFDEKSDEQYY